MIKISIGIEVHAQLNTETKLFSRSSNYDSEYPNVQIDFFSTGQLGWYPIINSECVKKAIKFGLALEGTINKTSRFFRKCYFYHDNPKNYQITQEKSPIVTGGQVLILNDDNTLHPIHIERVQLEEDTATTKNYGHISGINLNRAGSPLIEIITTPCIHSVKDAVKFCKEVRNLIIVNNIGHGRLELGEIRFDCNISIDNADGSLGERYEIKNLNSFLNIEKALNNAIEEQELLLKKGNIINESTLRWDAEKNRNIVMRNKDTNFYGFIDEVDVPILHIEDDIIELMRGQIAENPCVGLLRIMDAFGILEDEARVLSSDASLYKYVDDLVSAGASRKDAFSWVCIEVKGLHSKHFPDNKFDACSLISLSDLLFIIKAISDCNISRSTGKYILEKSILKEISSPSEYLLDNKDLLIDNNEEKIIDILTSLDKEFPDIKGKLSSGKSKTLDFLIGQIMKQTKGKTNPLFAKTLINRFFKL
ncbi:MAG: Asp-tRNA(Asn)/Glu-tRNA(Gln) amidotransferase subunit GatB [Chlamydiia bacterium]|nr:Asp-tRNA(Asn)/Glu-tRNA(Gln) amidotransferase subunit GatB [Chlamydiia bacterium]